MKPLNLSAEGMLIVTGDRLAAMENVKTTTTCINSGKSKTVGTLVGGPLSLPLRLSHLGTVIHRQGSALSQLECLPVERVFIPITQK